MGHVPICTRSLNLLESFVDALELEALIRPSLSVLQLPDLVAIVFDGGSCPHHHERENIKLEVDDGRQEEATEALFGPEQDVKDHVQEASQGALVLITL